MAFLPLFWYTIKLIHHAIPIIFFTKVIAFLISIGLASILNYVIILLIILFFGGLIYYIQQRISKLKQNEPNKKQKLISLSQCFDCKFKINYNNKYCPFCGVKLHKHCPSCSNMMIVHEQHCSSCGNTKSDKLEES